MVLAKAIQSRAILGGLTARTPRNQFAGAKTVPVVVDQRVFGGQAAFQIVNSSTRRDAIKNASSSEVCPSLSRSLPGPDGCGKYCRSARSSLSSAEGGGPPHGSCGEFLQNGALAEAALMMRRTVNCEAVASSSQHVLLRRLNFASLPSNCRGR